MPDSAVEPLLYKSYLAAIANSPGTKLFRNYYARVAGIERDVMENGVVSCAFFVSSLLALFQLIKRPHATVASTISDLEASGWTRVSEPRPGSVLLWEALYFDDDGVTRNHVGFYVGNGRAISNSWKELVPVEHDWEFARDGKPGRAVQAIFWHPRLG